MRNREMIVALLEMARHLTKLRKSKTKQGTKATGYGGFGMIQWRRYSGEDRGGQQDCGGENGQMPHFVA